MKLILSRKGFDSSFGGVASPILPDGALVSLPIPKESDQLAYAEIATPEGSLGSVVESLTRGKIRAGHHAHLDPDLRRESLPREKGWLPAFGQTGQAQTHLQKHGVDVGDLFLFFGWFKETERIDGGLRFRSGAPNLHVLFGWLQVGAVHKPTAEPGTAPDWAADHPHVRGASLREQNNTLYVASPRLDLPGLDAEVPGGGVFQRFQPKLQLTADGENRSVWRLPDCFHPGDGKPPLSHHSNLKRWRRDDRGVLLNSVARGQEFVLDCDRYLGAADWAGGLFTQNRVLLVSGHKPTGHSLGPGAE